MPDMIMLAKFWRWAAKMTALVQEGCKLLWHRGKECLQCRRPGFHPWVDKVPWRRNQQPTLVFLPGEFHRQRNLAPYGPWGHKESDTTEQPTLTTSRKSLPWEEKYRNTSYFAFFRVHERDPHQSNRYFNFCSMRQDIHQCPSLAACGQTDTAWFFKGMQTCRGHLAGYRQD